MRQHTARGLAVVKHPTTPTQSNAAGIRRDRRGRRQSTWRPQHTEPGAGSAGHGRLHRAVCVQLWRISADCEQLVRVCLSASLSLSPSFLLPIRFHVVCVQQFCGSLPGLGSRSFLFPVSLRVRVYRISIGALVEAQGAVVLTSSVNGITGELVVLATW